MTEFDSRAETVIVRAPSAAFPDDAIVGEEGGGRAGRSGRTWHVYPLDGTTNFAHGLPIFARSIGLLAEGTPVVGVVSAPAVGWTFHGARGQGAFLNDRPIHPSGVAELGLALLVTGFPYLRVQQHDNLPEFAAFMRASQGVRRLGSAALDLCFVACGWTIVLLKLFFERWRTMSDRIGSASARPRSGPRSAARRLLPPFSGSDKAVSNTQDSLRHHALVKRPVSSASPRRSPVQRAAVVRDRVWGPPSAVPWQTGFFGWCRQSRSGR